MLQVATPKKAHLISLGCARNRVDSEVMLGTLLGKGWIHEDAPEQADAVIVNTCGFIEAAKEESIDTILRCAEYKKENPELQLVVTGCLSQRYKQQLVKGLPEVDFFVGTDEFPKIAQLLELPKEERKTHYTQRSHYIYDEFLPRINTLSKHSAYVKVAEGCQHQCSFCIIPAIRGKLRSRTVSSIVKEVEQLATHGVLEVNLIAQDLAAYGREKNEDLLLPLLRELVKIEELAWIRLLYMYPENISDEFLEFFAKEPKLVKYLDIPMQHASDNILKAMKRDVSRTGLEGIITKIRKQVPGMSLRTSVMVGFPGETREDFEILKEFVRTMKFDHLGCFTYSKEEGTVAARMTGHLDEDVKLERQREIMELQQEVSTESLKAIRGRYPVLIEKRLDNGHFQGRLSVQAPEVDGVVEIIEGSPKVSSIVNIEIFDSSQYDLIGRL